VFNADASWHGPVVHSLAEVVGLVDGTTTLVGAAVPAGVT
jgi:hypothetical protein